MAKIYLLKSKISDNLKLSRNFSKSMDKDKITTLTQYDDDELEIEVDLELDDLSDEQSNVVALSDYRPNGKKKK